MTCRQQEDQTPCCSPSEKIVFMKVVAHPLSPQGGPELQLMYLSLAGAELHLKSRNAADFLEAHSHQNRG
jgi:hypothetical protein